MFDAQTWGARPSWSLHSASRRMPLHAAQTDSASATACPAKPWRSGILIAIIGVSPVTSNMSGRFKFQAPTSRQAPRLEPPILRTWCLNLLWCLGVGIRMLPERRQCSRPLHPKLTRIKRNQAESTVPAKKTHQAKTRKNHQFIGQIGKQCSEKHLQKRAIFYKKTAKTAMSFTLKYLQPKTGLDWNRNSANLIAACLKHHKSSFW